MIALTIPAEWVALDKTGEVCLRPAAVHWLDKLRALYTPIDRTPTPGFLRTLRQALNLTQAELGRRVGVNKITVSRWECGAAKPGVQAIQSLIRVRAAALRKGLPIATGRGERAGAAG